MSNYIPPRQSTGNQYITFWFAERGQTELDFYSWQSSRWHTLQGEERADQKRRRRCSPGLESKWWTRCSPGSDFCQSLKLWSNQHCVNTLQLSNGVFSLPSGHPSEHPSPQLSSITNEPGISTRALLWEIMTCITLWGWMPWSSNYPLLLIRWKRKGPPGHCGCRVESCLAKPVEFD